MDITELLVFSVTNNASDLHLSSGLPPMIRVDGEMRRLNVPELDDKAVQALIYEIMNDMQRKEYEENLEVDFSFEIKDLSRFRVNAFMQNRWPAVVLRTIPSKVLTLDELGAPAIFKDIINPPTGFVLITGATGSGKSTTLAAMIYHINTHKREHILTIEVLMNSPLISDLIQRNEMSGLKDAMGKGKEMGMQTFDMALLELYKAGKVSLKQALHHADSPNDLRLMIKVEQNDGSRLGSLSNVSIDME